MTLQYCFIVVLLAFDLTSACLNNYKLKQDPPNEWLDGSIWKTNAIIMPNFNYQLTDWKLEIEFYDPLVANMEAWVVVGHEASNGKTKLELTKRYDGHAVMNSAFEISYIVSFASKQLPTGHIKCAQICGTRTDNGAKICDGDVSATTTAPETTVAPETTAAPETTQAPSTGTGVCLSTYDYKQVLRKSLLFFEAQRSGKLPADNRIAWRGDSALQDGQDNSIDLSGGYYDAGDHVKFGFPMAATITNLAWGMLEFKTGYTLSGNNQFGFGLDALKWGTDYFIKCHPEPNKFYGQVGDGNVDHSYWGPPEEMTMNRPSYYIDNNKPGSELAGETAAALAASSLVFQTEDSSYAAELLTHAKQLYDFAINNRRKYHESIPAAPFYTSHSGYNDELAWASLWLYRATGDSTYKNKYLNEFDGNILNEDPKEFSWDNKWYGVQVLAKQLAVSNKDYLKNFKDLLNTNSNKKPRTPKGLIFIQPWAPLRYAANLAFLARVASTIEDKDFYNDFALSQINYMLGDTGRSYVVGFGTNPPQQPHHRSSSCPYVGSICRQSWSTEVSPKVLNGALVGGPDQNDFYEDKRSDYIKNEVACDYNAGFQSTIAGLIQLADEGRC